ncbi:MAG TPA: hypothetical protein VGV07_21915 [Devosia sp.]|jgi:hypothetical protein|uniref:hypothetical protein n=1 Tax=Devosia sp. TaxID=1871048 RepID=UPI002DDCDC0C|nr:hypothetical protein [Devosia sp.]HEV2517924.1 hypothetical protein [Devosia sp.]
MNAPFLRPHGCPRGVDPVEWRQVVEARLEQLQDAMLSLIEALNRMDGDTDLEPWLAGSVGETEDREGGDPLDEGEPNDWDDEDSDADEANGDLEPSLGGLAVMVGSKLIVDGEGDNSDLEYSLGWGFDIFSHGAAHMINSADREHDEAAV